MDFSKLFKTFCVGLFSSSGLLASSEDAEPGKLSWPPCLRTIIMNGHTFTQEELEHNARTGHPLGRVAHRSGAKAMRLSIEGPRITAEAFDPDSDPTWLTRMKALHTQKSKSVWYEEKKLYQPIMMYNAASDGAVDKIIFERRHGDDSLQEVIVAGYLTENISSTLGQKMVVWGVDQVSIIFRTPAPASWITPNFQDMGFNGHNLLMSARSRGLGEEEGEALTYTHKQKGAYLVTIQGGDIRLESQAEDFCAVWRARMLQEITAHNGGTPPTLTPGTFFKKDGFFYASAHLSADGKPATKVCVGRNDPTLTLKHLSFSREGAQGPALEKPIWISGYMDFGTLTTRGLLVEGLPKVSLTIGRAVSLADILD
ncbi:MAG: hypothetical protein C0514_00740 [Candidatus Puniceispirillum sp.]|nr:hypothetical protein [Candidatus Puniceispirillum sp.]